MKKKYIRRMKAFLSSTKLKRGSRIKKLGASDITTTCRPELLAWQVVEERLYKALREL